MKKTTLLLMLLLCIAACKKDINSCKDYKELSGQPRLIDVNMLNAPELKDTLAKYPQLQLYRFTTDNYGWTAQCNVFYQGLLVFSDQYTLAKESNVAVPLVYPSDTILYGSFPASLTPGISHEQAIKSAKNLANFDHTCISYRLGLFNMMSYSPRYRGDYRLAWKIQGEGGYPFVIIDANNAGAVLSQNGVQGGWLD